VGEVRRPARSFTFPLLNNPFFSRTDAFVRWITAVTYNCIKFVAFPLPKWLCNGRLASETATWVQKWLKMPVGTSKKPYKAETETTGVVIETYM
jgi:hypothetical protein